MKVVDVFGARKTRLFLVLKSRRACGVLPAPPHGIQLGSTRSALVSASKSKGHATELEKKRISSEVHSLERYDLGSHADSLSIVAPLHE